MKRIRVSLSGLVARVFGMVCGLMCVVAITPVALSAQTAQVTSVQTTLGFPGVDYPGSFFSRPQGVAVDANGDVFVADTANNAVKEIVAVNGSIPSLPTILTLGSGFYQPAAVAVDARGDVFVADLGDSTVKEIVAVNGSIPDSPTINTLGSGFLLPFGVAVDSNGNVFVGDTYHNAVKEIVAVNGSIPASPTIRTLGSGFSLPAGVAVDASGNVFVADSGNNAVKEMLAVKGSIPVSPTIDTLGNGFSSPIGVAVDANGDVFVADTGNNAAKEIVAVNGSVPASPTIKTVGGGFNSPDGVAVNAGGDSVFVADTSNSLIEEVRVAVTPFCTPPSCDPYSPPALSPTTASVVNFTFGSRGTIAAPAVVTQGAQGLAFTDAGTGTCTTNGTSHTYNAGDSCTVAVNFTPTGSGQSLGGVQLLNNAGTAVVANAPITGTGTAPVLIFPNNIVQTALGGGFINPYGVAVDASGDVFVADSGNNAVREIVAVNGGIPASPTILTLGSGFYSPHAIAVDGSGNVFVADTYNNAVKEIVAVNGSIPAGATILTLGSGFDRPNSVAVDASGDVFVVDTDNNAVKEIVAVNGSIPAGATILTLGSGFAFPYGVAVDASGDVFVADTFNNAVKEIVAVNGSIPAGATPVTLGSGFYDPLGVAVDASGNVFVADTFNNAVKEIVAVNGSIPAGATILTLGSGFFSVFDVAVDASGNVFVADTYNNRIEELNRTTPPSLSFASTAFGATSSDSPQTVTIENGGNASLIFPIPASGNDPSISSSFTLDSTGATACPVTGSGSGSAASLAPGASCTLSISFTPAATGPIGGSLVLTDNNLNAPAPGYAAQTISLNGKGTADSQTIDFPQIPAQVYGGGPLTLSATASSGLPVEFVSLTGAVCKVSGTTLTLAEAGTCTVEAVQVGNADYQEAKVSQSFTVAKDVPSITWPTPAGITYGTALSGTQLNATASVSGSFSYTPATGTVLAAGQQELTATFTPADATDYATSSSTVVLTVNPAAQTITFNPSVTSYTYSPSGTFPVSATASSGLPVTFSSTTGGVCTVSGGMVSILSGGTCTIQAAQTGNPDYSAALPVSVNFRIGQAAPTVTLTGLPSTAIYGAAPISFGAASTSGVVPTYSVTGPGTLSGSTLTITGAGTVVVTASVAATANYTAASVSRTIVVAKAPLTATAANLSRQYDVANPALTYGLTGFVNGDTSAVVSGNGTLTTTAVLTSPPGTYPITFATEGLTAANYSFAYVAGTLTVTPSGSQCSVIDYSKGFTSNGLSLNGTAKVTNGLLQLTDGRQSERASAYFATRVPTTAFDTVFTFQLVDAVSDGFTFIIQGEGPQALGVGGGGLGYQGIGNSIALKFDLHNNAGEGPDSTGLYLNGEPPTYPAIPLAGYGIDLHSGHVFAMHLHYEDAMTTFQLTDTLTGAVWSVEAPGDAAEFLGSNTAYFGFTAGTGGGTATQNILTWSYSGGAGCSSK